MAPAPRRRTLQRFFAWTLIVLGVVFMMPIIAPTEPGDEDGAIAALVMGLMMLAGGAIWLWRARGRDERGRDGYAEKAILEVAARNGGMVTVAMVALQTDVTMDEAEAALGRLSGRNIAQPDLLDDGSVVYRFGILR